MLDEEVDELLARLRIDPPQPGDRPRQLEDRRRQLATGVNTPHALRSPADEEGTLKAATVEARSLAVGGDRVP
jgi:hypothetical protein